MACEDEILIPINPRADSPYLMRNGGNKMTAPLESIEGSKEAPGLTFQNNTRTGFFIKDGELWVTLDGNTSFPLVKALTDLDLSAGDIVYVNADSEITKLPIGSEGDVLTVTSGFPAWVAP